MRFSKTLRTVAMVEAAKGVLVLVVGFGLLSLVHHDVQRFAERLVAHLHLNPAAHYPRIFIDLANKVTDARLLALAGGAALYSVVRFIEAYGLWLARRWAEWFAAASAGIYLPFEIFELYKRVSWLGLGALALNLGVVAVMLYFLFRKNTEKPGSAG